METGQVMAEVLGIRAARVFTADGDATVVRDGIVEIADGVIRRVRGPEEPGDPGIEIVDYGDATVLPGLVDAHCHVTLAGDRRTYEDMLLDGDELMALVAVQQLRLHLESGVTTIRDNGGKDRLPFVVREAVRRGYFVAPRMLLSGRPVTHAAGHFHWCNGVADGEVAIRAAVRRLVADGADHIKIMASGGGTGGNIPYLASYTTGELRVAVDAAHELERLTTAHARAANSMTRAIDAGLDCIEHAEFLVRAPMTEYGSGIAASGLMRYDPAITERLLDTGTHVSYTMQAGGYETLLDLRARLDAGEALSAEDSARRDLLEAQFEMKAEIFQRLLRDGAEDVMAISTDAGPFDVSFGHLDHGLRLAVDAGMANAGALLAATIRAARVCGVADDVGSLEPGKLADVLVVRGDPLGDIDAIRDVADVYLDGHRVPRLGARSPRGVRAALRPRPAPAARGRG
jgi:imidazolonepropionase-like amidohydrolase